MRRVVRLATMVPTMAFLTLALSGCDSGFFNFIGDTNTIRRNVNQPVGDSETMRRVRAQSTDLPPLQAEPGNIWPGPAKAEPTLEDLSRGPNAVQSAPQRPVPGAPGYQRGSSTPPGGTEPGLAPELAPTVAQPPGPVAPVAPPSGRIVQTPRGPAVNTGGTSHYNTVTTPGGQSAITIPNGNGTSTLIGPDGTVTTIPSK